MGIDLVQILPSPEVHDEHSAGRSLPSDRLDLRLENLDNSNHSRAKSFHIETFGCQMNDHDSEKVAGMLMARGYRPVDNSQEADLVLYNTCSIRERAAHKVFSHL